MAYLTASVARSIAQSMWGHGGTHAYKTNRKGVYYFSCAGHGGYVLPASVLTKEEYAAVSRYVEPKTATVYVDARGKVLYMHPYRTRTTKLMPPWTTIEEEFFTFEEDCEWAVLEKFTTIRVEMGSGTVRDYEGTFWRWYDENNPEVRNRAEVDRKRAEGDPDLIISALRQDDGRVKVWTADDQIHYVAAYNRDKYGVPYLSVCEGVSAH